MNATKNSREEGRPVSFSAIENQRIKLFEEHMSPHGVIFGGRILDIADQYSKIVAQKHCDSSCKTVGINYVRFFTQAKRGDILICKASVNRVWDTSLEIGVKIMAEDFRSLEQKHILSAYFTFELIDENEKVPIPSIICETEDQKRRYIDSQRRKTKIHKYQSISHINNPNKVCEKNFLL